MSPPQPPAITSSRPRRISIREIVTPHRGQPSKGFWGDVKNAMVQMTDLSLFKDPVYVLIALSNFLTNVGYDMPRVFLPDRAESVGGISKSAASWLLSIWGISNTVGRVLIGYVSDYDRVAPHRLLIYIVSLLLCGVVNVLSVFCHDYATLVVYSALFGASLSTYISLTSVILVDLLGLERLTNAFGLLLFFQGVGAIVGPPLGGWIVDSTGHYAPSFIFAGGALFVSGAVLFPILCLRKFHNNSNKHHISNSAALD